MTRTIRPALAVAAALSFSLATPGFAQVDTQGRAPGAQQQTQGQPGGTASQGGPHGSAPGPIAPQLQAVQASLLQADQQLSAARSGNQPPNYEQTLRALQGGEDTLAEMRNAQGGRDTAAMADARREMAAARQLVQSPNPDLSRVSNQLRVVANAITALNSGATGTTTATQPGTGGGAAR